MSSLPERLREQLDCRQIAERYGVRFRQRSSTWWTGHCFNTEAHRRGDRNPSLSMSAQGYTCFSVNCAISGDALSLIAHFEGLDLRADFGRVLELASSWSGLDITRLKAEEREAWRRAVESTTPAERWRAQRQRERLARREAIEAYKRGPISVSAGPEEVEARGVGRSRLELPSSEAESRRLIFDFVARSLEAREAPTYAALFPDPFDEAFLIDPRHERLEIMSRIWELVGPLELTAAARAWLERRGIAPEIAHAYGCRDWSAASPALRALFAEFSERQLERAGLLRSEPGGDDAKRWPGLRALHGEAWAQGLAVPIVHPSWMSAPIAWRWRLFEPIAKRGSTKRFKALAQYAGEPRLPSIPLGSAPLTASALGQLAAWPHLSRSPQSPRYGVALCEGEPDWLSVAQASCRLESEVYVVPVGLTAMSHGYPPSLAGLLEGAEFIVCLMDQGRTHKKWARQSGRVVVDQLRGALLFRALERGERFDASLDRINASLIVALQPDDRDINDLHRDGELLGLLQRLLGERL